MTMNHLNVALATATAHVEWDRRWADGEHRALWSQPQSEVTDLIPNLKTCGARHALDMGCGIGRHALALAAAGFRVTAMDASETGIASVRDSARESGLAISVEHGLMTDLPFPGASFDYLLAWNVIYHGDGSVVTRTLKEISRVLRVGGLFQGTLLSKRNANFGVGTQVAPDTFVIDDVSDKAHPHFYCNADEVVQLLRGFELVSLEDYEHRNPGSFHWHFVAERRED
jgi:2-polyprenyl-3-methyl-5-hydroxy-6-metoxy-1,4-benzoquinol methylase